MTAKVFSSFLKQDQSFCLLNKGVLWPWDVPQKRGFVAINNSDQMEIEGPLIFSYLNLSMPFLSFFFICQGFDLALIINGHTIFKKHISSE